MKCLTGLLLLLSPAAPVRRAIINGTVPNGTVGAPYPGASLTVYPEHLWRLVHQRWVAPSRLELESTTVSSAAATISARPLSPGPITSRSRQPRPEPNAAPVLVTQPYTVVIAGAQVSPVSLSLLSLPTDGWRELFRESDGDGGTAPNVHVYVDSGIPPPGLQLNPPAACSTAYHDCGRTPSRCRSLASPGRVRAVGVRQFSITITPHR